MSYPLLAQLEAPASLGPQLRTTLLAVGHVAAGDAAAAVAAFSHIGPAHRPKAYDLAVVQNAPLVGVPRALHSAAALQAAGVYMGPSSIPPTPFSSISAAAAGHTDADDEAELVPKLLPLRRPPDDPDALLDAGRRVFDAVYARNSARVQKRLHTMHPELCDWILRSVYGQLLSRSSDGGNDDDDDDRVTTTTTADIDDIDADNEDNAQSLSLRERELAVVAALCVDPVAAVQLASHLRGALNAGASGAEIEAVVQQTRVTRAESAESAEAVFATFRRARYAL